MSGQLPLGSTQLQSVEISLSTGGTRRFFYRETSRTDQEVIKQIFQTQNYNLSQFPLSRALKNYADQVAAAGASLLVVDAGANIGASSVYLTQLDPRIHVCAVEPEPGNYTVLVANSVGLPITPIEAAVASEAGKLWLTDPGIGEWGFRVGADAGTLQVAAITMADILGRFDVTRYRPLMCKMDIEGAERDLFGANDAWIDQFPLIVIELHDWMLPGTSNSKNFLVAIAKRNFDVIFRGENVFCFNNDLLFARNRFAEIEAQYFAAAETSADPAVRLNVCINRLISEGKSGEAAALLVREVAPFLPTNALEPFGMRAATSIRRLVIGNSHLMRNADAADIEAACGLPVAVTDLLAGQGTENIAPDTLVILASQVLPTEPGALQAIKALRPGCMTAVWLFDNHHTYLLNAQVACSADLCFPSHPVPMDYLSHVAPGRIGPTIPLATAQLSRPQLTSLWKRCEKGGRSDALSGHYAFYPLARRRNALLLRAIEEWPQADLSLRKDWSYHTWSAEDRFLQWRRYKASVCLPVANDLSNRFFDALAAGQVPIVASDILDLDRVIPPNLQASLPIICLQDYTVAALRDAHERAIAAFNIQGSEGAERRHRFVLQNHMLANRIRLLIDETAHLGRCSAQSDGPGGAH